MIQNTNRIAHGEGFTHGRYLARSYCVFGIGVRLRSAKIELPPLTLLLWAANFLSSRVKVIVAQAISRLRTLPSTSASVATRSGPLSRYRPSKYTTAAFFPFTLLTIRVIGTVSVGVSCQFPAQIPTKGFGSEISILGINIAGPVEMILLFRPSVSSTHNSSFILSFSIVGMVLDVPTQANDGFVQTGKDFSVQSFGSQLPSKSVMQNLWIIDFKGDLWVTILALR